MPYTKRPFQPETPYTNQVRIELNKANDNFDILSQAFVSNNPETLKVKEADTVDGFHASLTPGPNVIVPLNTSGVLDLSGAYVKSNVYTFRRVDLTGASQDYALQVGEEAYISFSNVNLVPLRIAVAGGAVYEMLLLFSVNLNLTSVYHRLLANNTTYSDSFSYASLYWNSGGDSGWVPYGTGFDSFYFYPQTPNIRCIIDTGMRHIWGNILYVYGEPHVGYGIFSSRWHSNLSTWTSLGSLSFPANMSGKVIIRRLF